MGHDKVVLIIDNLKTGGAEQVFSDICHLIDAKVNYDVLFVLPKESEAYKLPANIGKIYLNRRYKWSLSTMQKCANHLRHYSLAHVHMRHTFRYISLVKHLFNLDIKLLLHDHFGSIRLNSAPPFWGYWLFKPDLYIGVSSELTDWARKIWKLPANKSFTLVNLPSQRFISVSVANNQALHLKKDFVMVGNVKPIKNQLIALEVASASQQNIIFIGKNQDSEYANRLKIALDNAEGSQWLENIDDVSQVLSKYRLGLYTSLSESGPLVLIEYLLCGLPFLAYKTGGIAEVIYKYFPEYFMNDFNVARWVQQIEALLSQPASVDQEKLSLMLENEFNPELYLNKLMEIYAR